MSGFLHHEHEIPSYFDELESGDDAGLVMRTVIDFELISNDGTLVAIEDLGKNGTTAILVGHIIEPLPVRIRQSMINLSCTSSQDLLSNEELAMLLPIAQKRKRGSTSGKESDLNLQSENQNKDVNDLNIPLDHTKLKIGDNIDGYCNKTYRWYEAKVVDMKTNDQYETTLRIHFLGWNSKYDEWIPKESERIASRGSSSSIVLAAAKTASSLVPWWNSELLLSRSIASLENNGNDRNLIPYFFTFFLDISFYFLLCLCMDLGT